MKRITVFAVSFALGIAFFVNRPAKAKDPAPPARRRRCRSPFCSTRATAWTA